MNAPAALLGLIALLAADPAPPRYALQAQLEALRPAQDGARFTLRARLEAPPAATPSARATPDGAPPLLLTATLLPKAGVALCPTPGTIFFDGFELP